MTPPRTQPPQVGLAPGRAPDGSTAELRRRSWSPWVAISLVILAFLVAGSFDDLGGDELRVAGIAGALARRTDVSSEDFDQRLIFARVCKALFGRTLAMNIGKYEVERHLGEGRGAEGQNQRGGQATERGECGHVRGPLNRGAGVRPGSCPS